MRSYCWRLVFVRTRALEFHLVLLFFPFLLLWCLFFPTYMRHLFIISFQFSINILLLLSFSIFQLILKASLSLRGWWSKFVHGYWVRWGRTLCRWSNVMLSLSNGGFLCRFINNINIMWERLCCMCNSWRLLHITESSIFIYRWVIDHWFSSGLYNITFILDSFLIFKFHLFLIPIFGKTCMLLLVICRMLMRWNVRVDLNKWCSS